VACEERAGHAAIRPACARDVESLARIERTAFATDRLSPRSLRRLVARPTAILLVAEANGAIAGYALVLLRRDSRTARLYSLARDPAAPPGLGGRLLEAAEAAARAWDRTALRLEVGKSNINALRLYERRGYRVTGSRPGYYEDGSTALLMRKPL